MTFRYFFVALCFLSFSASARIEKCIDTMLRLDREFQEYWAVENALPRQTRRGAPTLAVIDGISSGADYSVRARQLFPNINVVHVKSSSELSPEFMRNFGFRPSDYQLLMTHNGNISSLQSYEVALHRIFADGVRCSAPMKKGQRRQLKTDTFPPQFRGKGVRDDFLEEGDKDRAEIT